MPRPPCERIRRKASRIHRLRELRPIRAPLITEEEIFGQLSDHGGGLLYLHVFSKQTIEALLARCGILAVCDGVGYPNPDLRIDTSDAFKHILRVYPDGASEIPLIEIVLRTACFKWGELQKTSLDEVNLLVADWVLLQNPRGAATTDRPLLPGQRYPGLGMGSRIIEFLTAIAEDLHLDGIVEHPQFYHAAVLYSKYFRFLHPAAEGTLSALHRDLRSLGLAGAAWAVHDGLVREGRKKFKWIPEEQVMPLAPQLAEYFNSDAYARVAEETCRSRFFHVVARGRRVLAAAAG